MTARQKENWAALTDVGRVRTHNEDSVLAHPPLFVVADGLGGHEAGEVASSIAIETLRDHSPKRPDPSALARAVRAANREVIRAAREGIGREGMGTTMTAAIVEGTSIAVAQVGDSRAYLYREGRLSRITQDHSFVHDLFMRGEITAEEAFIHPRRNVITRALGTDPNMIADGYAVDGQPGDRLLLCTDGLSGMLTEPEMATILGKFRDPTTTVRALIDAANEAGGTDNITAIIVDIRDGEKPVRGKGLRFLLGALGWVLGIALVLAGAAGAAYLKANDRAYLTVEGGRVVLYRGVPGELMGLQISSRVEKTDILAADLPLSDRKRLDRIIKADSVEEARQILDELEKALPDEELDAVPAGSDEPSATSEQ